MTFKQLRKQNFSLGRLNILFINFTGVLVSDSFYFNALKFLCKTWGVVFEGT